MGQRGRPKPPVVLASPDREVLERWTRRPSTAQALAMRARIVLAAAEGGTNRAVADKVGVNEDTGRQVAPSVLGAWRARAA